MKTFFLLLLWGLASTGAFAADLPALNPQSSIANHLIPANPPGSSSVPIKGDFTVVYEERVSKATNPFGLSDVILSVLITAIFAGGSSVLTLWLANRHSRKLQEKNHESELARQKAELDHDAREKREDRKIELRRTVYLALPEFALGISSHFSNMVLKDIDLEMDPQPVVNAMTALANIVLVADLSAQKTATELNIAVAKMYFSMVKWRLKSRKAALDGPQPGYAVYPASSSFQYDFADALVLEMTPLRQLFAKLMAELKTELGIDTDAIALAEQFEDMAANSAKELKDLFAETKLTGGG